MIPSRKTSRKNTKKVIVVTMCIAFLVLLGLLITNVAVCVNPFDGGGCFSVALDKFQMLTADRVVIRVEERSYETTDPELIRLITSETRVATNTDLSYPKTDRWIDIYRGDVLIRSMRWADNLNQIVVYHADNTHWVFPSYDGDGIILPSTELINKLIEVIDAS